MRVAIYQAVDVSSLTHGAVSEHDVLLACRAVERWVDAIISGPDDCSSSSDADSCDFGCGCGSDGVDLLVLPEMFATGYSMDAECCSLYADRIVSFAQELAGRYNVGVIFSASVRDAGKFYNRLYFVMPDGSYHNYDKRHLFRMAHEHDVYRGGGVERLIVEFRGVRICPLICYDLRFPVYSRNRVLASVGAEIDAIVNTDINTDILEYDMLVYVAAWPAARGHAWRSLLVARAIENQAFVVGCNCSCDPAATVHKSAGCAGESVVLDFLGMPICSVGADVVDGRVVDVDIEALKLYRKRFPAFLDADHFAIQ